MQVQRSLMIGRGYMPISLLFACKDQHERNTREEPRGRRESYDAKAGHRLPAHCAYMGRSCRRQGSRPLGAGGPNAQISSTLKLHWRPRANRTANGRQPMSDVVVAERTKIWGAYAFDCGRPNTFDVPAVQ